MILLFVQIFVGYPVVKSFLSFFYFVFLFEVFLFLVYEIFEGLYFLLSFFYSLLYRCFDFVLFLDCLV